MLARARGCRGAGGWGQDLTGLGAVERGLGAGPNRFRAGARRGSWRSLRRPPGCNLYVIAGS